MTSSLTLEMISIQVAYSYITVTENKRETNPETDGQPY